MSQRNIQFSHENLGGAHPLSAISDYKAQPDWSLLILQTVGLTSSSETLHLPSSTHLDIRGVTRHLSHETRRDTRLGSREREETRFLDFKKKKILNDEIYRKK